MFFAVFGVVSVFVFACVVFVFVFVVFGVVFVVSSSSSSSFFFVVVFIFFFVCASLYVLDRVFPGWWGYIPCA